MKKMLKKCIKYALNKFGEINIGIFNKKKPSFYALKGKRLIEKNRIRAAIKTFKKGLYFYPNSLLIHREWARYLMSINEWEKAIYHWEFVFKSKNKKLLNSNDFLNASDAYIHKNQYEKASRILEKGNKAFPFYKTEYDLNQINILLIQKKWKLALDFLIENQPPNTDLNLRYIYKKLNLYKHVKRVLRANTKYSLEYKEISEAYINLSIYRKNWNAAINRGKHLIKQHSNLSIEILMKLGMLHQIIGSHQEASGLFKRIEVMQDKNTQKHQKIILFDNGESRIEFYKKSHEVEKVIITFDSINMEWDKQPFGFSLLKKKNIDIIAVRKRKKQTYQQDLTQEDFYNTVYKLMYFYTDKIAYGFSLGAYSALYYTSLLNCRILSLAPRLSIHPRYGRKNYISKYEFKHNLSIGYNDSISPVIVYDPKNKIDNNFVTREVMESFPNAHLVKIPYGGHRIAPNLLKMGVLKDFILTFIEGNIPSYDRKLKTKSPSYFRHLGTECLKRGKLEWANSLSNSAIELSPKNKFVIELKVKVLKEKNNYKDAIDYTKEALKLVPRSLYVRLILIDLYIETEDIINAEKELQLSLNKFPKRKILKQKKEEIGEAINDLKESNLN